ncbi:MAG: GNAT family N-acetyltransferase [Bacteroidetes bacterium]|nr:MAG: GNAT family N-acetyltransferase [Bacteroidota bacterium]
MTYLIKDAQTHDLKKIAACHIAAFPDSLTSKLGIEFISNMFKWYLSGSNKFLFWIEGNNQCIGYCGGYVMDGSDAYGASSGMTQFGFNSAIKAMLLRPWLFFHPEVISKYKFILTNLKRRVKKILGFTPDKPIVLKAQTLNTNNELQAGLVIIGVSPQLHKKGIGSLLQVEFEKRATQQKATLLSLSVRRLNDKAISSYKRNGWEIKADEGPSYLMTKKIANNLK